MSIRSVSLVTKLTILAVVLIAWFFLAGCSGPTQQYIDGQCAASVHRIELYELCLTEPSCSLTKVEKRKLLNYRILELKWCEHPLSNEN